MNLNPLDAPSIVRAFAAVARPIIRSEYDLDSCIVSTRIAIDTFNRFGLRARPMVARMRAFNAAMARCLAEGGPHDSITFERWDLEHGARTSSLGYADGRDVPRGYWAGPLVALVEREVLVDASADQASRPHDAIYLPGVLLASVTPKFRAGLEPLVLRTSDGCGIVYEHSPSERSYQTAPYWKSSALCRRVTDAIVATMEFSLGIAVAA
jgi:hypothetical protein